jgi:ribosomal protein S18 acetylase RimI-like enzyme
VSTHFAYVEDIAFRRLDGPPEHGFDCGRPEQTMFLYERALADQEAQLSVTHLYYVQGILGAYATVCMDALPLGRREREPAMRFQEVGALKLAQLGVSLTFQGMGLGRFVVGDVISRAQGESERVGCRYVTLDAQPDLVGWYERLGFQRNTLRQDRRLQDALAHGRDPASIAVSMRYDLRR